MKLYTVKQAAEMTGRAPVSVRALALKHEREGDPIGRRVLGRWGFTAKDIERMRQIRQGVDSIEGKPRQRTVIRHRWGPEVEGRRSCKNCGAVQVMGKDGNWSSVPPCK